MKKNIFILGICSLLFNCAANQEVAQSSGDGAVDTLAAPRDLTGKSGKNFAELSWESVAGAESYEVWYCKADESGVRSLIPQADAREEDGRQTFTVRDLEGGNTYYFWVTTANENLTSDFSKALALKITGSPPAEAGAAAGEEVITGEEETADEEEAAGEEEIADKEVITDGGETAGQIFIVRFILNYNKRHEIYEVRTVHSAQETTLGILPEPKADNATFKYWNTKPDGSGVRWTADTPVSANLTLYAIWG